VACPITLFNPSQPCCEIGLTIETILLWNVSTVSFTAIGYNFRTAINFVSTILPNIDVYNSNIDFFNDTVSNLQLTQTPSIGIMGQLVPALQVSFFDNFLRQAFCGKNWQKPISQISALTNLNPSLFSVPFPDFVVPEAVQNVTLAGDVTVIPSIQSSTADSFISSVPIGDPSLVTVPATTTQELIDIYNIVASDFLNVITPSPGSSLLQPLTGLWIIIDRNDYLDSVSLQEFAKLFESNNGTITLSEHNIDSDRWIIGVAGKLEDVIVQQRGDFDTDGNLLF